MYELKHSAKGTHWSKKDHKYVKKENGRYYYKDDMKQKQIDEKDQRSEAEMLEAQATKETEDFFKYMGISPDDPLRDEVFNHYKEGNLNKLYEMRGKISPKEAERQKEANKEKTQHNRLRAADQDPAVTGRNKSKGSSADAKRWSEFLVKKEQQKKTVDSAITKAKDALNSSKAVKAAKSVAKAYAEVKNEKVKEHNQKELQYSHMNEATKKVGETKIMGSTKQHTAGELTTKVNASAQKARLNRANSKKWDDKGYRNPSDKRYYE